MATCHACGEKIIFRYINGQCVPIHLSGGCYFRENYDHYSHNGSFHDIKNDETRYSWLYHGSITFLTTCWWCNSLVYFHRNEDGGCALFDELGYPWPVHKCWKEYSHPPDDMLKNIILKHLNRIRNGEYLLPRADLTSFANGSSVKTTGYLFKKKETLELVETEKHGSFIAVHLHAKDGYLYRVYLPIDIYPYFETFPCITAVSIAWRRGDQCNLFLKKMSATNHKGDIVEKKSVLIIEDIINDKWSFKLEVYGTLWEKLAK